VDRPSREEAWRLLTEYTQSQSLRRHALAVEATMRELARSSGIADLRAIETWGLLGLLHDFDYERFPTEDGHPWRGMEILRERGWPDDFVRAVGGHAFYTGIERTTPMMRAILAADELTGFVGACALIRPSKRLADLPVESVLKRLKDKSFARTVDRNYVYRGAEEWGVPLADLVALVLRANRPIAGRLGLDGRPADDLLDDVTPSPPPAPAEAAGSSVESPATGAQSSPRA
jgi:predicted hydrolase (HD superfamily)